MRHLNKHSELCRISVLATYCKIAEFPTQISILFVHATVPVEQPWNLGVLVAELNIFVPL
jgi:hypothetical protein